MKLNAVLALDNNQYIQGMGTATAGTSSFVSTLREMAAPLAVATAGFAGLAAASRVMMASVREAARIEDLSTSFVTLLGSTDAAKERLEDLANFAAETPFELPEIAQASRTLETLTRGALSTGEGLKMVGNVAAATQQPFGELAVVIGRLYDGIQSGRPVGEAMMRLQELGVISGQVRSQIEALQAEGARGEEVWNIAGNAFGRFAGEMDRRSLTLNGRVSTLSDAWKSFQRELGSPLLEAARGEVTKLTLGIEELTMMLRDAKAYWADVFGVAQGRGVGGLETVKGLIERARAMETLADREKLVLDVERELAKLQDRAVSAPSLDFAPAINQTQRLLSYLRELPAQFFKITEAQRNAAKALAEIEQKRPDLEKVINESSRGMQDERDRSILRDPNADPVDRQISAIMIGQRATEGLLATPPQNLEQAKEQLELEMELVEQMRKHPEMLELAAKKAEGLVQAYREVVGLLGQTNGIVSESLKKGVSQVFDEVYGTGDSSTNNSQKTGSRSRENPDQLQRIGGFIGYGSGPDLSWRSLGLGGIAKDVARTSSEGLSKVGIVKNNDGPSADYARRSAVANEKTAIAIDRLALKLENLSRPEATPWI